MIDIVARQAVQLVDAGHLLHQPQVAREPAGKTLGRRIAIVANDGGGEPGDQRQRRGGQCAAAHQQHPFAGFNVGGRDLQLQRASKLFR